MLQSMQQMLPNGNFQLVCLGTGLKDLEVSVWGTHTHTDTHTHTHTHTHTEVYKATRVLWASLPRLSTHTHTHTHTCTYQDMTKLFACLWHPGCDGPVPHSP